MDHILHHGLLPLQVYNKYEHTISRLPCNPSEYFL
jgi:hypothetical protein